MRIRFLTTTVLAAVLITAAACSDKSTDTPAAGSSAAAGGTSVTVLAAASLTGASGVSAACLVADYRTGVPRIAFVVLTDIGVLIECYRHRVHGGDTRRRRRIPTALRCSADSQSLVATLHRQGPTR